MAFGFVLGKKRRGKRLEWVRLPISGRDASRFTPFQESRTVYPKTLTANLLLTRFFSGEPTNMPREHEMNEKHFSHPNTAWKTRLEPEKRRVPTYGNPRVAPRTDLMIPLVDLRGTYFVGEAVPI